jgi:hypothetical protein
VKRGAGNSVGLGYEVWGDVGKVHNSRDEDVDLDAPETGLVTACVPVQHFPVIPPVPCRASVEAVVFLAKLLLDGLRTAWISGEAKDVKILIESGQLTCKRMCGFQWERTFGSRPSARLYNLHATLPMKQQSSTPISLRVSTVIEAISRISSQRDMLGRGGLVR